MEKKTNLGVYVCSETLRSRLINLLLDLEDQRNTKRKIFGFNFHDSNENELIYSSM